MQNIYWENHVLCLGMFGAVLEGELISESFLTLACSFVWRINPFVPRVP